MPSLSHWGRNVVSIQLFVLKIVSVFLFWFHFLKSHIYVIIANNICFRFPINRNIKNQNCIVASTIFLMFAGNLNFALQSTKKKTCVFELFTSLSFSLRNFLMPSLCVSKWIVDTSWQGQPVGHVAYNVARLVSFEI